VSQAGSINSRSRIPLPESGGTCGAGGYIKADADYMKAGGDYMKASEHKDKARGSIGTGSDRVRPSTPTAAATTTVRSTDRALYRSVER
jgi:hypothetical protein